LQLVEAGWTPWTVSGDGVVQALCKRRRQRQQPGDSPPNYDGCGPETRPYNVYAYYLIFTSLPQTAEQ